MISVSVLNVSCFDNQRLFQKKYSQMSQYRKDKINRYKLNKDKMLSLGAGVLIDEELKKRSLCDKQAKYILNENGKPSFAQYPDLHFNLSHSKSYAVCVFSDNEVGIDIEKITEPKLGLAKRFFSKSEYSYLAAMPTIDQQKQAFFRLWVLKESYIKAIAKGMALPLNQFSIDIKEKISVSKQGVLMPCSFYEFSQIEEYKMAVAVTNQSEEPTNEISFVERKADNFI